jgi:hypothetical protein
VVFLFLGLGIIGLCGRSVLFKLLGVKGKTFRLKSTVMS